MTDKRKPAGSGLRLEKREATQYAFRAGKRRVADYRYSIEDDQVSTRDMAQRLGVAHATAQDILRAAQQMPGAVTWASLQHMRDNPTERQAAIEASRRGAKKP